MNMNQNLPNSLIKLKFWGENHDGLILQPRNSTLTFASEAKYEIKVGIVNFLNYLEDMGKIKLLIFEKKTMNQIGHVLINLFLYLKRNLQEDDFSPLQEIDEVFPIIRTTKAKEAIPQKIGEIDISLTCLFEKFKQLPLQKNKVSEVRGKYARPHQPSPTKDSDSSFLLNEMKAQNEIKFDNKENVRDNNPFDNKTKSDQSITSKEAVLFAKSLKQLKNVPYEVSKFQQINNSKNSENINFESQLPQKISKEGVLVPNSASYTTNPHKLDEILNKAKNLQNKLNNFELKPPNISNPTNNFQPFQSKREESSKPMLFDTITGENKIVEYPIEKIGNIIATRKHLSPELELQKLKLDEAGYMDSCGKDEEKPFRNKIKFNDSNIENFQPFNIYEQKIGSKSENKESAKKKVQNKNFKLKLTKLTCTHQSMIEKFRKTSLNLSVLFETSLMKTFLLGKFKKANELPINQANELAINQELDLPQLDNINISFKITSSLEKIEMELAKGQISLNPKEIIPSGFLSVKMFSCAIPEQIAKKDKPKVIKTKIFKEDNLKKIETETLIGEIQLQINEEIEILPKALASQKNQWIEKETPIYYLLLNIEKISNLENPSNILIRYKIYSTLEKMETPVFFNVISCIIDHRISMPLNSASLHKTEKIPLVLEIWNKQENDQLIGLIHLDLKPVYSAWKKEDSLELNKFPFIIYDDSVNIKGIAGFRPKGFLTFSLAFGTLTQISKYEQNLKDKLKQNEPQIKMNNSYSHSEKNIPQYENFNEHSHHEIHSAKILENQSKQLIYPSLKENENVQKPVFLDTSDHEEKINTNLNYSERVIISKVFLKLMQNLIKNQENLRNILKNFLEIISKSNGLINYDNFETFLKSMKFDLSDKEITAICHIFDYENNKKFLGSDFSESYKAYLLFEEQIQIKLFELTQSFEISLLKNQFTFTNLEKEINKLSDFGYIQKKSLENLLLIDFKIPTEIFKKFEYYFSFGELVPAQFFIENFSLIQSKKFEIHFLESAIIGNEIIDKLLVFLRNNENQRNNLLSLLVQRKAGSDINDYFNLREIMILFRIIEYNLTFIESFFVIKAIDFHMNKKNEIMVYDHKTLSFSFCEFFMQKISNIKEPSPQNVFSPIKQKLKADDNDFDEINDLNSLLNEKKSPQHPKENEDLHNQEVNLNNENLNQKNEEKIINEESIKKQMNEKASPNNFEEKKLLNINEEEKLIYEPVIGSVQHQLKLKCYWLENLELSKLNEGNNLTLRYKFPNEENIVESKIIIYEKQKRNYEINMNSSHSITLPNNEDIKYFINDRNAMLIELICKNQEDEMIGKTVIPLEYFFMNEAKYDSEKACYKSKSIQTFPLYREDKEMKGSTLLGKLHFKFSYAKIPIEDENKFSLKQTKFQKFLPKKGYLNICIEKISNFKSLLKSVDFETKTSMISGRDFYTAIYCEPFSEDDDLNSLIVGFETPLIYEKLAYGLNYMKNYPVTMNSIILNYFQTKNLRLELRIYFNIKDEEAKNEEYVMLGYCEIPLIGLIININGSINEDFCLKNESSQFNDVFIKLNMSFTEKPLVIQDKSYNLPPKPCALISFSILELVYDEMAFEEIKQIYFQLSFKTKNLKSGKTQLGKNNNGYLFLNDINFEMKSENSQELMLQPLEIKIMNEDDQIIGYLNFDLSDIIKKNKDNLYLTGYFVPINPDCLKSNSIKMRVGIKCIGFFFENESLMTRHQAILDKITQKNCFNINKLILSSKEIKLWDAVKLVLSLSQFEINKLQSLFANSENLNGIFSNEIADYLTQENKLDDLPLRKELLKEFCFYDYENCGYIDIDNAQRIFTFFGDSFKLVKKEKLNQFLANNINHNKVDSNALSLKLGSKFDYLVFIQKIFETPKFSFDPDSHLGYEKIYQNTNMIENFFAEQSQTSKNSVKFQPFTIYATILYANNLDILNRKQPPIGYFSNEKINIKTELFYRIKDPQINYSFTLEIKSMNDIEFDLDLYFRSYNLENSETIYYDKKISTLNIQLNQIYQEIQNKNEILINHFMNQFASITIRYSLSYINTNLSIAPNPMQMENQNNYGIGENDHLTSELIENFNKTLNEINGEINIYDNENIFSLSKKIVSHKNFNDYSNKKNNENDESPSKLEKTILELDELNKNLTENLEANPNNIDSYKESEYIKGFSFGKNAEKNNNPFENVLYQSNVSLKQKINKSLNSPEKIIPQIEKIEEVNEKYSPAKSERKNNTYLENTEIDKKYLNFDKKPPLSKNSSLQNLKEMDNVMNKNKEFDRIANILKGNSNIPKGFYDFSSDSE